jgi:mono/diheme cytochrome c family protein
MEASTAAAGGEPGSGGAAGAGGSSATGASLTLAAMVAQGDPGRGGKLYEENHCNGCHGTKEKPAKKFPNVFKVDYSKDDEIDEAFSLIKKGKSPMPGFGDKLDDKAVADIVAYMKAAK